MNFNIGGYPSQPPTVGGYPTQPGAKMNQKQPHLNVSGPNIGLMDQLKMQPDEQPGFLSKPGIIQEQPQIMPQQPQIMPYQSQIRPKQPQILHQQRQIMLQQPQIMPQPQNQPEIMPQPGFIYQPGKGPSGKDKKDYRFDSGCSQPATDMAFHSGGDSHPIIGQGFSSGGIKTAMQQQPQVNLKVPGISFKKYQQQTGFSSSQNQGFSSNRQPMQNQPVLKVPGISFKNFLNQKSQQFQFNMRFNAGY